MWSGEQTFFYMMLADFLPATTLTINEGERIKFWMIIADTELKSNIVLDRISQNP